MNEAMKVLCVEPTSGWDQHHWQLNPVSLKSEYVKDGDNKKPRLDGGDKKPRLDGGAGSSSKLNGDETEAEELDDSDMD